MLSLREVFGSSRRQAQQSRGVSSLFEVFLFEATGNIVRLLNFPEEIADRFESISPKYGFTLAKVYALWLEQHFPKEMKTGSSQQAGGKSVEKLEAELKKIQDILRNEKYLANAKPDAVQKMRDAEAELRAKIENAPSSEPKAVSNTPRDKAISSDDNFRAFMDETGGALTKLFKKNPDLSKKFNTANTIEDVNKIFDEIQKDEPQEEGGKVLLKFSNGYFWTLLDRPEHSEEAKLMQHCATDGRGQLVSLRDGNNKPHVTMTFNREKNTIYQIKGKQNVIPDKKYWPFIEKFSEKFKPMIRDSDLEGRRGGAHGFVKNVEDGPELKALLMKHAPAPIDKGPAVAKIKQLVDDPVIKGFLWPAEIASHGDMDWQELSEMNQDFAALMTSHGYKKDAVSNKSVRGEFYFHPQAWQETVTNPPPVQYKAHWYVFCAAILWRQLRGKGNAEFIADPVAYYKKNKQKLDQFWEAINQYYGIAAKSLETVLDKKV